MDFSKLVLSRRSTRSYTDSKITEDEIKEIISCALEAPTWKNSQTGRYYVGLNEKYDEVFNALPEFNQQSVKNSSCLIVTTFVKNRSGFNREGVADNELGNEWGAYDLGLQNSLLLLKAKELGFDSLVMGLRDANKIREIFNISDQEEVVSVIALGVGTNEVMRPKRKEIDSVLKID